MQQPNTGGHAQGSRLRSDCGGGSVGTEVVHGQVREGVRAGAMHSTDPSHRGFLSVESLDIEVRATLGAMARSAANEHDALVEIVGHLLNDAGDQRDSVVRAVQTNTALHEQWRAAYAQLLK